jgi:hypothetical protein
MAVAEGVLGLARLVANFRFEPVPGYQLELEPRLALRPKNGLPLHVQSLTGHTPR